jgi:hypothetical protein
VSLGERKRESDRPRMVIQGDRFGYLFFLLFVNILRSSFSTRLQKERDAENIGFCFLCFGCKDEKNICSCKQCSACSLLTFIYFLLQFWIYSYVGGLCLFPRNDGKRKEKKRKIWGLKIFNLLQSKNKKEERIPELSID